MAAISTLSVRIGGETHPRRTERAIVRGTQGRKAAFGTFWDDYHVYANLTQAYSDDVRNGLQPFISAAQMSSGNLAQFWVNLEDDSESFYGRKNPRASLGNI